MKITFGWNGPDKRYVIAVFPPYWTWQEFDAFKAEVDALIQTLPYEVGAVADVTESTWLPQGASRNLSRAFSTAPEDPYPPAPLSPRRGMGAGG